MSTTTYRDLLAKKKELDEQIAKLRSEERDGVIEKIREMMADYQISLDDIRGKTTRKTKGGSVEPKYRDPASGRTWSGRGKPPRWIAGQDRAKFLITD